MDKGIEKAKDYALRLLKFRLRSRKELETRLRQKKYTKQTIAEVLKFLENTGFIDDFVFARAWINSRLNFNPRSRGLLVYELRQKGIPQDIITKSLNIIQDEDEENLAWQLAKKRFSKLRALPQITIKRRLSSYLTRRGFKTGLTFKIINELVKK